MNDENNNSRIANRFSRYVHYATLLLSIYKGSEPFHLYIKKYFAANKKHGSKDRRIISGFCYAYFRLGNAVSSEVDLDQKWKLIIFLLLPDSAFADVLKPEWQRALQWPLTKKLELVKNEFSFKNIFNFHNELSEVIKHDAFSLSILTQPKIFIRIRPGNFKSVVEKLNNASISFDQVNESCLAFTKNEKLDEIIHLDKEAVVQDYNSQKTLDSISGILKDLPTRISLWDCCAASGGKSILAADRFPNLKLTVSDIRKSILENLKARFKKAGIRHYDWVVADLTSFENPVLNSWPADKFNLIIADVPCTGSGTWARTPEQTHFFSESEIVNYQSLQRKIITQAVKYLQPGGYLLFITCSVFKKENEDNVNYLENEAGLELINSIYLKGYEMQADTLFTALFRKS